MNYLIGFSLANHISQHVLLSACRAAPPRNPGLEGHLSPTVSAQVNHIISLRPNRDYFLHCSIVDFLGAAFLPQTEELTVKYSVYCSCMSFYAFIFSERGSSQRWSVTYKCCAAGPDKGIVDDSDDNTNVLGLSRQQAESFHNR